MTTEDLVNELWNKLYHGDPATCRIEPADAKVYDTLGRHPLCRKMRGSSFRYESWTDQRDRWIAQLAGNLHRMPPAAMSEADVDLLLACADHPAVQGKLDKAMGEKKAAELPFALAEKALLKQLGVIGVPQWQVCHVSGNPWLADADLIEKLQEGWEPIGGPVSTPGADMFLYFKRLKP